MDKKITSRTISFLFFISGAAALIYQIVWFKYLSLFIGNSTYAQSIVLATFMAGLTIGSYVFGKKSDSVESPVILFAVLEIAVGIYCFFFPYTVLLKYIIKNLKEAGKNIGFLYYINSFGAVAGCFIAGFFLIQLLGLKYSIFLAALADLNNWCLYFICY
ncbi:MAG: hypothetical protein H0X62_08295 [Bacteroidetes bacterium]|nr:hypothetical protein [Bacteroidota bacterium]